MATVIVSAQVKTVQKDEYEKETREKLLLDYSVPDYSTSKIDEKVMGPRLAKILEKTLEISRNGRNLGTLSVMQSNQIEGISYCWVEKIQLSKVIKRGNEITITFVTKLGDNAKNLKKAKLVFIFIDGVSKDIATNDFFSNICRYINE